MFLLSDASNLQVASVVATANRDAAIAAIETFLVSWSNDQMCEAPYETELNALRLGNVKNQLRMTNNLVSVIEGDNNTDMSVRFRIMELCLNLVSACSAQIAVEFSEQRQRWEKAQNKY